MIYYIGHTCVYFLRSLMIYFVKFSNEMSKPCKVSIPSKYLTSFCGIIIKPVRHNIL